MQSQGSPQCRNWDKEDVTLHILSILSLVIWLYLFVVHGNFWRSDQKIKGVIDLPQWPQITAVIPARNEVETIGLTVSSLLEQDYPGSFNIIVVDDNSDDGTAQAAGLSDRLKVISGKPITPGWSGKVWAMSQGINHAEHAFPESKYLLLSDADIEHHPLNLRELVCKAETENLGLVSLMVKLRCHSLWEKLLIPAFIFFFQKLYPFPRVNNPARKEAAAAGGCMLAEIKCLNAGGGIEAIRERLIDDCALAALIKPHKAIWLGLSENTHSLRAYETLSEIWDMVARTAFVQLNHSILALIGVVIGMCVIYLVPPFAMIYGLITGQGIAASAGGAAWMIMFVAFAPTLQLYQQIILNGLLLPVAGVLYTFMTISSALRHWKGKGGAWKGRSYPTG